MSSTKNVKNDSKQGIRNDSVITSETTPDVLRFLTILYDYDSAMKTYLEAEPSNSENPTYLFQANNLIKDVETACESAVRQASPALKKDKKGKKGEKGDAKEKKEKKKPAMPNRVLSSEQSPKSVERSTLSSGHLIKLQK